MTAQYGKQIQLRAPTARCKQWQTKWHNELSLTEMALNYDKVKEMRICFNKNKNRHRYPADNDKWSCPKVDRKQRFVIGQATS